MRIRTQLTLVVSIVVALVVALAGLIVVIPDDSRNADELDRVLATRAASVRIAAERSGALTTDGTFAIRLIDGGSVRKQVGTAAAFPLPARNGYSTVSVGDTDWRALTEPLVTGAQLQVLVSLAGLEERHTDNVLMVDLLVLLAALLSAVGVWFATGLVLRPYQRLVKAARRLDPADPGSRLAVGKPREVAELAEVINRLLDRTRNAAPAPAEPAPIRRTPVEPVSAPTEPAPAPAPAPVEPAPVAAKAAEPGGPLAEPTPVELPVAALTPPLADLGANLDTLLDHPELPATQRHLLLAAMADDHRRLVTLLEALRPTEIKDLP